MSTNKTPKLGMHSWAPSDYVKLDEFNENFNMVDSKFGEVDNKLGELGDAAPVPVNIQNGTSVINVLRDSPLKVEGLKGRTLVNLLGRDGNCEDVNKWNASQSSLAIDGNNKVYGNNSIKITLAASSGSLFKTAASGTRPPIKGGNYYIALADVKNGNASVGVRLTVDSASTGYVSETTKFTTLFRKYAPTADGTVHVAIDVAGSSGQYAYTDGIRLYEITQAEYNEIDTMSSDQVAAKYPYVDDLKSIFNPYLIAESKNLLPPFTKWTLTGECKIISAYELEKPQAVTGSTHQASYQLKVAPSTVYTLSVGENTSNRLLFHEYDKYGTLLLSSHLTQGGTITTRPDTDFAVVAWYSVDLPSAPIYLRNPMLVLGSEKLQFEPQSKSYQFIQTTLRSNADGTQSDEFYFDKNGQPTVIRKQKYLVLDGSLPWSDASDRVGYKRVSFSNTIPALAQFINNSQQVVKYDGKILAKDTTASFASADVSLLNFTLSGSVHITVPDADSGWGENYVPTTDEIKAYFYGWRMYNSAVGIGTPYNGTGTKGWVKFDSLGNLGNTSPTVPTEPNGLANFTPYQLQYQATNPVAESVTVEGDLLVSKGFNQITFGAGIIVREAASPYYDSGARQAYINEKAFFPTSNTKYNVKEFFSFYKNNDIDDLWEVSTRPAGGQATSPFLRAHLRDPNYNTAIAYSTTYFAQDMYLLGFAAQSINAAYVGNLSEVVKDLTVRLAEAQTEIDVLRNTKANKQQPGWISPTLLNGWTNFSNTYPIRFFKDSLGFVHLQGLAKGGTVGGANSAIFKLPQGYIPGRPIAFLQTTTGAQTAGAKIEIIESGYILVQSSPTGDAYLSGISFRAEQ